MNPESKRLLSRLTLPASITLVLILLTGCQVWQTTEARTYAATSEENFVTEIVNDKSFTRFSNGLNLVVQETDQSDVVGIAIYIDSGVAEEDPEKAGAAYMLMRMLPQGTSHRNADEISDELAALGTSLTPVTSYDYSAIKMKCVRDDFEESFELLSDVLMNPSLPIDNFDIELDKTISSIKANDDQPGSYAAKYFRQALFGEHPYGRPVTGYIETLSKLTPVDLYEIHQNRFVPTNFTVVVVGKVDAEDVRQIVEKHLGKLEMTGKERYNIDKIVYPGGARKVLFKDSQQGYVLMGNLVSEAGHEDAAAVEVAATILGGGMSSRLFSDLRDEQGLAYALGTSTSYYRHKGYIMSYIGTAPENLHPAPSHPSDSKSENELWKKIDQLRSDPVSEEELIRAKNYIAGSYLRSQEKNLQKASTIGYWEIMGLGLDHGDKYLEEIQQVTSRDIMKVANKYFLEPTVVVLYPPDAIVNERNREKEREFKSAEDFKGPE